jgi:hypothetical protein
VCLVSGEATAHGADVSGALAPAHGAEIGDPAPVLATAHGAPVLEGRVRGCVGGSSHPACAGREAPAGV